VPNEPIEPKYRKFYVEWWKIRQSTIFVLVTILLFFGLIGYGGWRFLNSDFVNKPDNPSAPKDAAIVVSFEGDVRIIRAATRETILVTRQTDASRRTCENSNDRRFGPFDPTEFDRRDP
jgi:hypothetical protein